MCQFVQQCIALGHGIRILIFLYLCIGNIELDKASFKLTAGFSRFQIPLQDHDARNEFSKYFQS